MLLLEFPGWFHLHCKMDQLKNERSQNIVLMYVIRIYFLEHSLKNVIHRIKLLVSQFENMRSAWLENRILIQVSILMKEMLIEYAEHTAAKMISVLPFIGYLWV